MGGVYQEEGGAGNKDHGLDMAGIMKRDNHGFLVPEDDPHETHQQELLKFGRDNGRTGGRG